MTGTPSSSPSPAGGFFNVDVFYFAFFVGVVLVTACVCYVKTYVKHKQDMYVEVQDEFQPLGQEEDVAVELSYVDSVDPSEKSVDPDGVFVLTDDD